MQETRSWLCKDCSWPIASLLSGPRFPSKVHRPRCRPREGLVPLAFVRIRTFRADALFASTSGLFPVLIGKPRCIYLEEGKLTWRGIVA